MENGLEKKIKWLRQKSRGKIMVACSRMVSAEMTEIVCNQEVFWKWNLRGLWDGLDVGEWGWRGQAERSHFYRLINGSAIYEEVLRRSSLVEVMGRDNFELLCQWDIQKDTYQNFT